MQAIQGDSRRRYTKGFVRKDVRSHKWIAVLKWTEEGKWRSISKSTGIRCYEDRPGAGKPDNRGKTSAEQFLSRWRDEVISEQALERERNAVAGSSTPFYDYANRFVDSKYALGAIARETADGYRGYVKKLCGTDLGNTPISQVTHHMVEAWELEMIGDGLSPTTMNHIHMFCKSVFRKAMRAGDASTNPFELVDTPRIRRKPVNSLEKGTVSRLKRMMTPTDGDAFYTAVLLATFTGMRIGEICALRVRDVNLRTNTITVAHSLDRRNQLAPTKTQSSTRRINFGPMLADILAARLASIWEERTAVAPWDESLFLVGDPMTGKPLSSQVLSHQWHHYVRANRVKGTQGEFACFHDLRHTFISLAIADGVDPKTVSAMAGHSSSSMTMDVYAGAMPDAMRAGARRVDAMFGEL